MEPEKAEAYPGLVMADGQTPTQEAFGGWYFNGWIYTDDKSLSRFGQFAGPEQKDWLDGLEQERQQKRTGLNAQKQSLKAEIANCKGLFSGGKRR